MPQALSLFFGCWSHRLSLGCWSHRPSLCLKVGCRRQSCRLSVFMHTQALEPQAQPSFFCSLAPGPQAQPLCSPRQSCRGSAQLCTRSFGGLRRSHDSGSPRPVEGCRLWAKPAETSRNQNQQKDCLLCSDGSCRQNYDRTCCRVFLVANVSGLPFAPTLCLVMYCSVMESLLLEELLGFIIGFLVVI